MIVQRLIDFVARGDRAQRALDGAGHRAPTRRCRHASAGRAHAVGAVGFGGADVECGEVIVVDRAYGSLWIEFIARWRDANIAQGTSS